MGAPHRGHTEARREMRLKQSGQGKRLGFTASYSSPQLPHRTVCPTYCGSTSLKLRQRGHWVFMLLFLSFFLFGERLGFLPPDAGNIHLLQTFFKQGKKKNSFSCRNRSKKRVAGNTRRTGSNEENTNRRKLRRRKAVIPPPDDDTDAAGAVSGSWNGRSISSQVQENIG